MITAQVAKSLKRTRTPLKQCTSRRSYTYKAEWTRSIEERENFWGERGQLLKWIKPYEKVLDDTAKPFYKWFTGGKLNVCENALDRHLGERPQQIALIHDSAMLGKRRTLTYFELQQQVALFAGVLAKKGVTKGDRVLIYMPMIPEAAIAMLACARLGAIHTVVFGGYAAEQLTQRIDHCKPRLIIAASCGLEPNRTIPYKPILDAAVRAAKFRPLASIIFQREVGPTCQMGEGLDFFWHELMSHAVPHDIVPVDSNHPLYILYTSGTTGNPKGLIRDSAGYCVALQYSLEKLWRLSPGDRVWAATDIGWVVGHSYVVYGPLLSGLTSVMYEGKPVGTPDANAYWRVISENKVDVFFTAPTALRQMKIEDPEASLPKRADLEHLRSVWLAGEHAEPSIIEWVSGGLNNNIPVIDHWWQTESGWPMTATPIGLDDTIQPRLGTAGLPVPGYDLQVLDDLGAPVPDGTLGNVCVKLPLPPGNAVSLYKNDELYKSVYLSSFEGYYATGDSGIIDEDGFVSILARTDDVINVAGIRLSTAAIEEIIAQHPSVAECCVLGARDPVRAHVPIAFVVLTNNQNIENKVLLKEVNDQVRSKLTPVAALRHIAVVPMIPKTRSGKMLRNLIQQLSEGEQVAMPPTIDNPESVAHVKDALVEMGYQTK